MRQVLASLFLGLAAMGLLSCGIPPTDGEGPRDVRGRRPAPSVLRQGPAFSSEEARLCAADLQASGTRFSPLPDRDFGGGCAFADAVQLIDAGTPVTGLGPLTCPLARNFIAWIRFAVRPAARKFLGAEVVRVETFGTYSCRQIAGSPSGRLSQHAYANAVDVAAFRLADGRRITVETGWVGDPASRQFLHALHKSACRRFGTVLGPDYNMAHKDHLHMDMSGNGYCR